MRAARSNVLSEAERSEFAPRSSSVEPFKSKDEEIGEKYREKREWGWGETEKEGVKGGRGREREMEKACGTQKRRVRVRERDIPETAFLYFLDVVSWRAFPVSFLLRLDQQV